jgi:putative sterol carrier protein
MSLEDIDRYFEMDGEELRDELDALLDDVEGNVGTLVEERGEDVPRLMDKLDETDAAEFANEEPELADRFQSFLWDLTSEIVESSEDLQDQITQGATVNFAATDSPMEGHLHVDDDAKTLDGGPGHVDGADLHIEGDSDTLVGMLTGSTDLVQGFMAGEFEMDGDVDTGMELASVMEPIYDSLGEEGKAEA